MEGFLGLLFFGAIIWLIVYSTKKNKEEQAQKERDEKRIAEERKQKELDALKERWEAKKREIETQGLPIVTVETLNLTKDEVCHFVGQGKICKIKQETVGYESGSRGVSLRVMKGVSFRVGNYRGHDIKQEVVEKTNGTLYLTSKKIIFISINNPLIVRYKDTVTIDANNDMLQIQTEKKTYLFQIEESLSFMVILEHILNKMKEDNVES